MKRIVSCTLLTLLIVGSLGLMCDVRLAAAGAETVYINSDGSVTPSGAPISSPDNVTYTLAGNVSYPVYYGVVVERSNIIINGNGYTVQGNASGIGFNLTSIANVTIRNTNVNNFQYGIYFYISSNCTITANNATANSNSGIILDSSSSNTFSGNNASANTYDGIDVLTSSSNTFSGNNASANTQYGIYLDYSSDSNTVSGNNATANGDGIRLALSNNNAVSGNNASANSNFGIALYSSSSNTFSGNNASANSFMGIYLVQSNNSIVAGNNMANNFVGISLDYSSSNNTVSGNNITANNWAGILLYYSSSNNITANSVANNNIGLMLISASGNNTIYHNNFVGNSVHASVDARSLGNVWNDSYPSGGNYWDNYTGVDAKIGPNQDLSGSDGIGDTPYVIDGSNQDNYPLMKPFPWDQHDIGITSMGLSKTVCGQGYLTNVSIMIFNYGENTEALNVTAYANETIPIEIVSLELTSRTPVTVNFTWNTTGFAKGNYSISAYAWPVPGETSTADNNFTGGWVVVSMVGDLTGGTHNVWDFVPDGKVGSVDISVVARCFGSSPDTVPPMRWEPNCDLNNNGHVDGSDVAFTARHFGEADP